jgi:hypothetical protein
VSSAFTSVWGLVSHGGVVLGIDALLLAGC